MLHSAVVNRYCLVGRSVEKSFMLKIITQTKRYPIRKNEALQGWDSADELILDHLSTLNLKNKRILIVNDQFGAISNCLIDYAPTTYTDSFVSFMGIRQNSQNQILPIFDLNEFDGLYDFVLIQLPKNMSFFEDLLCHLTEHLHRESDIICTGMIKHMAPASFALLQKYVGDTTTSLAKKKARLIFAKFQKQAVKSSYPQQIQLADFNKPFVNHSNLFSREKLDIGTRFFLEHIPVGPFTKILDLGCANGIIGIKSKILNPEAQVIFSDESAMAIQSAKENYQRYFADDAKFHWTNCFENQAKEFLDLVLCNPPFHQQNTLGDFIAWQMFQDSYTSLKKGGRIRVIGNSHLGYHLKLKKLFGNSKIVATNNKFIICEALK